MQQAGNRRFRLATALERARRAEARASDASRRYEAAMTRRLAPGTDAAAIDAGVLRPDPDLASAREAFRAAHRRHVTLRDACAGLEEDLAMADADRDRAPFSRCDHDPAGAALAR